MIVTVQAGAASAILRGHPWVYREAILATRGSKLATGDVVRLADKEGKPLGWGLYDAASPIAVRIYGHGAAQRIDAVTEIGSLCSEAIARRDGVFDAKVTTAYRLCNGEGDRVPGLVIDRYGPVAIARTDGDAMASTFEEVSRRIVPALQRRGVTSLSVRIESNPNERKTRLVWGEEPPDTLDVLENEMTFEVDIAKGQKTGAFLDQRDNRARVRDLARGKRRVLNLFSYAGGFSVAAALGGAETVTSVDSASRAHATAQRSFRKNGLGLEKHRFVTADAFVFLEEAKRRGEKFDIVISDPPSFAPNERSKKKGLSAYEKLHRACAGVLEDGGLFCASSCSSHVRLEEFASTLDDVALGRSDLTIRDMFGQPSDHPTLASFPEGRYLKFVVMG